MSLNEELLHCKQIVIRQKKELFELLGYETRNKYEILNQNGQVIGYCAEERTGIFGTLFRFFLGHWRPFVVHFYNNQRQEVLIAKHPFRFFFRRFEIQTAQGGRLGILQQRFSVLRKKFDLQNAQGDVILRCRSGWFQFWTFPIFKNGVEVGVVKKKWSGALKEIFLDSDNFSIEFNSQSLSENERVLILASSVFIDLIYFEKKAE